ncbi:unnamed protein product, partial [Didymodactylos carnosus]
MEMINFIHDECDKRNRESPTTDNRLDNSIPTMSLSTISCDREEEDFMQVLTEKTETVFGRSVPPLMASVFGEFVRNILFEHHYDLEKLRFKEKLTMNSIDAFVRDLQATHDSVDAFRAAWDGKVQLVKDFLGQYPTFKDKPGPWGTTLLYSAARNNKISVVEYLVSDARCSVNAQNQQHFERALSTETITAADYQVSPKFGSTALHGACFAGHLRVVQYLIEHGANYFIRNQAEETSVLNAELHPDIVEYLRNLLNRGYLKEQSKLPETPITQMNQRSSKDCVWEFLPFLERRWLPFQENESNELNQSLVVNEGQQFNREIQWNMTHTVSMVQFLRRGNQQEDLAWIRCRGSSILNFDCYALWQLLFLKHPNGKSNSNDRMS